MKKRRIVGLTILSVFAFLLPLGLVSQYGIDETNYFSEYIDNLNPIKVRQLQVDKSKYNVAITNINNENFKILQLSDTHFVGAKIGKKKDFKTLEAIYKMIDYNHPDLVIYTGDIVYPMFYAGSNDNLKATKIFNKFLKKLEVPFLYQYGNHDTDFYGTATVNDINEIFQSNPYCYAVEDTEISIKSGRLSQVVELRNQDGTLNNSLFLMDSNTYNNGQSFFSGYACFTDRQVYWYEHKLQNIAKREKKDINELPSLLFCHIPPYEYKEAVNLLNEGNTQDVEYLFGKNDESVSTGAASGIFEKILEYQSTKGIFFGHDHKNALCLRYKGIGMYYSHAIDYRAYPSIAFTTKYRGGNLITIKKDGTYEVEQQLLIDILNEEK